MDDRYASGFAMEKLIGRLAGIFAALAMFISCLGLFGLAAYMAEQRTREIGIRKVLGASMGQLVTLLGKEFIVLVGVSCLIASPVAFYFLQHWLEGYYYRISLGPGVFIVSAAMAIVITIVTISVQALKAALMNPVRSLRTEWSSPISSAASSPAWKSKSRKQARSAYNPSPKAQPAASGADAPATYKARR